LLSFTTVTRKTEALLVGMVPAWNSLQFQISSDAVRDRTEIQNLVGEAALGARQIREGHVHRVRAFLENLERERVKPIARGHWIGQTDFEVLVVRQQRQPQGKCGGVQTRGHVADMAQRGIPRSGTQ